MLIVAGCAAAPNTSDKDSTAVESKAITSPREGGSALVQVFECADADFSARIDSQSQQPTHILWENTRISLQPDGSNDYINTNASVRLTRLTDETSQLMYKATDLGKCQRNRAREPRIAGQLHPVDFRGQGNEPGWLVELSNQHTLAISMNYGADQVIFDAPEVYQVDQAIHYSAKVGQDYTRLVIKVAACVDNMSGEQFAARVQLTYRGENYNGCGRVLNTPSSPHH